MQALLTLLTDSCHDAVIRSQVAMQNLIAAQAHGDELMPAEKPTHQSDIEEAIHHA